MPQDIPMINWAPYFTSGENFGQAFNQDFNQAQRQKFEQARAIVDDEFTRQRLAQQQQSADQLGAYYGQLGRQAQAEQEIQKAGQALTAAGQAETARHNKAMEPSGDTTEEEKQKFFMSLAGPQGLQMPIGPATDLMKATPGYALTPQQVSAYLAGAAKVPGQNIGMQSTLADIVPHEPTPVAPSPDQAFMPGTEGAIQKTASIVQAREALIKLRNWQIANGNLKTQAALAASKAHVDTEMLEQQIKQNQLDMAKKWGDRLNQLKIDAGNVASFNAQINAWNAQIRANSTQSTAYKQAKDNTQFALQVINSQLGDVNKQLAAKQKELDTNDKHKLLVSSQEQALKDAGDEKDTGQIHMQYLQAQADYTASALTSVKLKADIDALKKQKSGFTQAQQNAMNNLKQQATPNGQSFPLPNANPKLGAQGGPPPNAAQLKASQESKGLIPSPVAGPQAGLRQRFYDKQGNAKWFNLKNGKWVPE